MPYLIQVIREYTDKVDNALLKKKQKEGQPETPTGVSGAYPPYSTPGYVPNYPPGTYPPGAYPPPGFDQFGRPI